MSDYGDDFSEDYGSPDFIKDPDSIEDYTFNWAASLDGDTINSSIFLLPDGLTEASSANDSTSAQIFVSGGTRGQTYRVTNRIVTASSPPRTFDKTIRILIREL